MKKILFLINAYNRPVELLRLLSQIAEIKDIYRLEILIFEDHSDTNYEKCKQLLVNRHIKHEWFRSEMHCGKLNYWQIIHAAYQNLKSKTFDYLIHMPDDIELVNNFMDKAISVWESISDPRKVCLNLLREINRNNPGWTQVQAHEYSTATNTGWVDMCYLATPRYFNILRYEIHAIDPQWSGNPERSSGVGMQISRRLVCAGMHLYQVKNSLVKHGIHESVMHPQHRKLNPLITNDMKITASVASMPSRERSLGMVVESILPQVGELWVYLNEYKKVPSYLNHPKIKVFRSQNELGDLGDAGKFYNCHQVEGIHLTIDDDLVYPPDYVTQMVFHIEKHKRKYAITCHGRRFGKMPVASYYRGATENYACLQGQLSDAFVHCGGTGVMAYHTDTLKLSIADFPTANMADIWFAKVANDQKVPILSIAHQRGWIKESQYDRNYTIFNFCRNSDSYQTEVINSIQFNALPVL